MFKFNNCMDIFSFSDTKMSLKEISEKTSYYLWNIATSIFKYDNLPETMPRIMIEKYIMFNGVCAVTDKPDGKLRIFFGALGGIPNEYYLPTEFIISNPYLKYSANLKIDEDCVLFYNDKYLKGCRNLIESYTKQISNNLYTLYKNDIYNRIRFILTAQDTASKNSAELFLKRLNEGDDEVVKDTLYNSFNKIDVSDDTYIIRGIEYHQYLMTNFLNTFGIKSNYNMKRERLQKEEIDLMSGIEHVFIDDLYKSRLECVDRINSKYNTEIGVVYENDSITD